MRYSPLKNISLALVIMAGFALDGTAADSLSVQSRVTNQEEMGQVTWFDLQTKLGKFSLIPPANWRPQPRAAEGVLSFRSPDMLSLIEIRFRPGPQGSASPKSEEAAHQALQRTYPGAVIAEEFPSFTSVAPMHTCDARWKPGKATEMAIRLAVAPCSGGVIEFHLYAQPEVIKALHPVLASLMVSFTRTPSEDNSQPLRLSSMTEKQL